MTDGLKPAHRQAIIDALAANPKVERIVLFGSRATGTFTLTSDVDLALFGDNLTLSDQAALAEAVAELSVPQRVDILIYHRIESQALREDIRKHGVEWFARERASRAIATAEEWQETIIGNFAPFSYGKGLPERQRDPFGDVPVFGSSGIVGFHAESLTAGPTVIIGRKGTVGTVYFSSKEYWPIDTTFFVEDKEVLNARFKYYLFKSLGLEHMNADSAVPGLNREAVHARSIRVPPLPEQRAIAHILGTLDDKIELNRRMSETLEAMARALFKAWFVDFAPVRAKLEGRWQAGQSLPGLPAHLYHLFPDRLVDSELGQIPKGWEVGTINDICSSIENGGTPRRMETQYWNGSIPWFKTGELTDGPLLDSEEKITEIGLTKSSCKLWPTKTILVALYASPTVGRLGILETSATANQACSGLIAKANYGYLYLFYSLLFSRDRLQYIAAGAAQQNISQQVLRQHKIIIAPSVIAQFFHRHVEAAHQYQVLLIAECRALAGLRDALLPKLIRGEMRVKDAERFLKERGL
jgi:type I restriction enzyme S subunit